MIYIKGKEPKGTEMNFREDKTFLDKIWVHAIFTRFISLSLSLFFLLIYDISCVNQINIAFIASL